MLDLWLFEMCPRHAASSNIYYNEMCEKVLLVCVPCSIVDAIRRFLLASWKRLILFFHPLKWNRKIKFRFLHGDTTQSPPELYAG
jgi:hypothetical protein